MGSNFYRAPEIGFTEHYTNKVDMWALGVMFYRMLFGEYPYSPIELSTWEFDIDNIPKKP
jgi:serine/threonine protein kinase